MEQTVPQEVVERDRALEASVIHSEDAARKTAAGLAQFRWEMCECPKGPRFSHTAYGDAVGRARSAISQSVRAWASTIGKENLPNQGCTYPDDDHAGLPKPPTESEVDQTAREATRVKVGTLRALAIDAIVVNKATGQKQVTEATVRQNHSPLIRKVIDLAGGEAALVELTESEAHDALDAACAKINRQRAERDRSIRRIRQWMSENRGLGGESDTVPLAEGVAMYDTIVERMVRNGITFAESERERRDWDLRAKEAERSKNEMIRKARLAVNDLRMAVADMRRAAQKVRDSVEKITADQVPITDDERELIREGLVECETQVAWSKVALHMDSGADWDKELQALGGAE